MEVDEFNDRIEGLIENSKYIVIELKKKLNVCVSKKEYKHLTEKIILNQENIVYLVDLSKEVEDTMEIYSDDDLEDFFENIQSDIDNSLKKPFSLL